MVARLFHQALSLCLIAAWVSLGVQVEALVGSRGLAPIAEALREAAHSDAIGWLDLPTLFWFVSTDFALQLGVLIGVVLAAFIFVGMLPRVCLALSAVLYLSYAVAGDVFLAFQWDNLLVETCALGALLPADRSRPLVTFMFRVLLFKLYFESGVAKWLSSLHDWQDGSAMTFYFETAPLPTFLAWYAHRLPSWVLHAISHATLVLELLVPLWVFGPRRLRTWAALSFTAFQVINTMTANYGFFTYLACALHLFLLDDAQLAWLARRLPRWATAAPGLSSLRPPIFDDATNRLAVGLVATLYLVASWVGAVTSFSPTALSPGWLRQSVGLIAPLRIANTYHLFASITRERIEPVFEVQVDGRPTELQLPYKPGDPLRAPPFVAPHQPRFDFRLWFYGLSAQHGMPAFVRTTVQRLCHDPEAIADLFKTPLPARPDAVAIRFYRYRFASPQRHAADGAYWERELLGSWGPAPCINTP